MSTTQMAAVLFQLQQDDLDLDRQSAEKQSITMTLQQGAPVRRLRMEYEAAQQQQQAALRLQKEAEQELEHLTHRQQEQERRLYGGSINNAKELQALQVELQNLRTQQDQQEELVLEAIEASEALAQDIEQKRVALEEAGQAWEQESVLLQERLQQIESRIQDRQKKRQILTAGVDADLLKRYETLRRTRQGKAVSRVEHNSCQWCRVTLTPSELQRLRLSREIQTCMNCARILYYER